MIKPVCPDCGKECTPMSDYDEVEGTILFSDCCSAEFDKVTVQELIEQQGLIDCGD